MSAERKLSERPVNKCTVCDETADLKQCGRCKIALYCSKEHQVADWPQHTTVCAPIDRPPPPTRPRPKPFTFTLPPKVHAGEQHCSTKDRIKSAESVMPIRGAGAHPPHAGMKDFVEVTLSQNPSMYDVPRVFNGICRNVIDDMNQYGLCVVDNFLGARGDAVVEEVSMMYEKGVFKDGQVISNHSSHNRDVKTIRGDKITWVDGTEPSCPNIGYLVGQVDAVVMKANKMPNNGKLGQYNINGRTKAMVACYPGGGKQYVKHVDNPNKDGRCLTAIYYLNKHWQVSECGGLLRIFPEGLGDQVADIEPQFDRLLFFWSDRRNPHEVQPAFCERYAITLWYFDQAEREQACKRYEQTS